MAYSVQKVAAAGAGFRVPRKTEGLEKEQA